MGIEARLVFADKDAFFKVQCAYVHTAGFKEVYEGKIENAVQHLLNVLNKHQRGDYFAQLSFSLPIVWGKVKVWGYVKDKKKLQLVDFLEVKGFEKPDSNPEIAVSLIENGAFVKKYSHEPLTYGESIVLLSEEIKNIWKMNDFHLANLNWPKDLPDRVKPKETYLLYRKDIHGLQWELYNLNDKNKLIKQIDVQKI